MMHRNALMMHRNALMMHRNALMMYRNALMMPDGKDLLASLSYVLCASPCKT